MICLIGINYQITAAIMTEKKENDAVATALIQSSRNFVFEWFYGSIRFDIWALATSSDNLHIEIFATQHRTHVIRKDFGIGFDVTKMFYVRFWVHVLFCPLMEHPPIPYWPIFKIHSILVAILSASLNGYNINKSYKLLFVTLSAVLK